MPTLQQQIAARFLAKLEDSKSLDADQLDRLRTLLTATKPKADDFVAVFQLPPGGDLK